MRTTLKAIGAAIAAAFWATPPLVQALLGLMMLDIVAGLVVGGRAKKLSSNVSFAGMRKKAMMLIITMAAHVATKYSALDLPLDATALVAGFFCATELMSIVENAALLGLPLPRFLLEAIAKGKPKGGVDA